MGALVRKSRSDAKSSMRLKYEVIRYKEARVTEMGVSSTYVS